MIICLTFWPAMGYWCSQGAWKARGSGRLLPSSLGESVRLAYGDTETLALQYSPKPSQAHSRGRKCGIRTLPESRPSLTIGSQVHFCLCHLPSHLKGSQDGFIRFLILFQLSLIILQISKSSPAGADKERNRPSATGG